MTASRPDRHQRRGSVSILILAMVVLMSALLLTQARSVIALRKQSQTDSLYQQAQELADAGMLLAEQNWRARGESWQLQWELPSGAIHQTNSGRVAISVTADGVCTVRAIWIPAGGEPLRVSHERKFTR